MKKTFLVLICVLLCMFAFTAGVSAQTVLPEISVFGDTEDSFEPLGANTETLEFNVALVTSNVSINTLRATGATFDAEKTTSTVKNNIGYITIIVGDNTADDAKITLEIVDPISSSYGDVTFGDSIAYSGSMGSYQKQGKTAVFTMENGRFIGEFAVKGGNTIGASYVVVIKKESDNNQYPVLNSDVDAETQVNVTLGEEYTVDLDKIFSDPDGNDTLTYTVSVNGGEAETVASPYKLNPEAIGSYTLKFVANDGQLSSPVYTVSLIVLSADAEIFDVSTARGYNRNSTIYLENYIKEMAVAGAKVSRLKTIGAVYGPTIEFWLAPDTAEDAEIVITITDDSVADADLKFKQIKCTAGSVVSPALNDGSEMLTETSAFLKIKLSDGEFSSSFYTDPGGSIANLKVHVATQEELDANNAPTLGNGYVSGETHIVKVGYKTSFDLLKMFTDNDHDALTYTVKENNGEEVKLDPPVYYGYTYTATTVGETILVFTASDGKADATYTVNFDVVKPVDIPSSINPSDRQGNFYISNISIYGAETVAERALVSQTNPSDKFNSKGVFEILLHPDTPLDGTFYGDVKVESGGLAGANNNNSNPGTITCTDSTIACTLVDGKLDQEIKIHGRYQWMQKTYIIKAHVATQKEWYNHEPALAEGVNAKETKNFTVDTLDENANDTLTVDLNTIFADEDKDEMTYTVTYITTNNLGQTVETTEALESSVFTKEYGLDDAGTYMYRFGAKDSYETAKDTYTVTANVTVNEHRPCISETIEASATTDFKNTLYTVMDEAFVLDLTKVFSDPDEGDTLTYTVAVAKEGGEAAEPVDAAAQYSFKPTEAGKYELTFSALDSHKFESRNQYIVTLYVGTVGENAVAVECDAWPELNYLSFYQTDYSPVSGNKVHSVSFDEESNQLTFDLALADGFSGKNNIIVGFCYQPGADAAPYLSSGTFTNRSSALNLSLANNEISDNKSTKYFESKDAETNKFSIVVNGHVVHENNEAPALKEGVENTASAKLLLDDTYSLNLADIFADPENDKLTYTVSVDDAEEITAEASYSISFDTPGTYELKFYAADYDEKKSEAYTVSVLVREAAVVPTNTSGIGTNDKWVKEILVVGANVGKYKWTANDDAAAEAAGYTEEANDAVKGQKLFTANYDNEVTIYLASTTALDAEIDLIFNYDRQGRLSTAGNNSAHRFNSDEFNYLGGDGINLFGRTVVTYAAPEPLTLEDGKGTYYYRIHSVADTTKTYPHNYKIHFVVATDNNVPVVAEDAVSVKELKVGQTFEFNLSSIFSDADEADTLTYTVSKNGAKAVACEAAYADTSLTEEGTYTYVFTAIDDWGDRVSHTVTVSVRSETYGYDVNVPSGLFPAFYGVDSEGNLSDKQLTASFAPGENGYNTYNVRILPEYSAIAVVDADEEFGSVVINTKDEDGNVLTDATVLRPVEVVVNNVIDGEKLSADDVDVTVAGSDAKGIAAVNSDGFPVYRLVVKSGEYVVTAAAKGDLSARYSSATATVNASAEASSTVKVELTLEATQSEKDSIAAKEVVDAINALPAADQIGVDDEAAVKAAREAYEALTDDQKDLVTNEAALKAAEEAVAAAKDAAEKAAADKAAADAAEALIEAIGEVTLNSKAAIDAARAAYDALTDDQKALVENLDTLTAAEAAYAELMIPAELPFTDIPDAWYQDAIRYVYESGIMNGMTTTTFEPGTTLSRAMYITMIYRMEGEPAVKGENTYTDVKDDFWYTNAIIWGTEAGIVNGYGDGIFKPEGNVTRQEMAKMMYCYALYKGADLTASANFSAFADGDQVAEWAAPYMAWVVGSELMKGDTNGNLNPAGNATRAEAATVIMRFAELVK